MSLSPRTEGIATNVVDATFSVHSTLGPGLLESVYEECLAYEFDDRNLVYERQLALPINYKDHRIDTGLRLDFLVENEIVLEIKAVESLVSVHTSQLLAYLKLGGFRLGFLMHFNVALIKNGIHRFVL
jgi:GxxExxY protein